MPVRKPLKHKASKRAVLLYDTDVETLQYRYQVIGYNAAVREIVHKHCERLRKQFAENTEDLPNVRIN